MSTEVGFGLFGKDASGAEVELNWSPSKNMLERVLELGHYQKQGFTDLEIRSSSGSGSAHATSLQRALENSVVGRQHKKRRKQEAVKRAAAVPDARFVNWAEFKQAVEELGVVDTDPISSITCSFPVNLEGVPNLSVARDDLGITTICHG